MLRVRALCSLIWCGRRTGGGGVSTSFAMTLPRSFVCPKIKHFKGEPFFAITVLQLAALHMQFMRTQARVEQLSAQASSVVLGETHPHASASPFKENGTNLSCRPLMRCKLQPAPVPETCASPRNVAGHPVKLLDRRMGMIFGSWQTCSFSQVSWGRRTCSLRRANQRGKKDGLHLHHPRHPINAPGSSWQSTRQYSVPVKRARRATPCNLLPHPYLCEAKSSLAATPRIPKTSLAAVPVAAL